MPELHDSIAKTRLLLEAHAKDLWGAAYRVANDDGGAARMAHVAAEAEHAADALFSVLSAAKSYLADPDAEAAMFPEGGGLDV